MIYVSFLIFNAKLHNNYQLCNNYVKIYVNMMYNYLIIACYVTFWEIFIRYQISDIRYQILDIRYQISALRSLWHP